MFSKQGQKSNLYEVLNGLLKNRLFILSVFIILPSFICVSHYLHHSHHNNYRIFIYTYFHAVDQVSLFVSYPEYGDTNHYGPFFSLIIAPFALLPEYLGAYLWELVNTLFLFYAVQTLPLKNTKIIAVYWIIANELLTSLFACQINPAIAAIIILSYTLIERKQNFMATCLIMLGTFIKLYGIVGLAFFFFAKEKPKYIAYCIFWAILFFVLPMVFFGPSYILSQYREWYVSLSEKQLLNASLDSQQDISVMGFIRRITQNPTIPNLPFLLAGVLIFVIPYFRISQYKNLNFRMMYLASALIMAVIFSNSSESPTYIIAFAGIAIWFVLQTRPLSRTILVLFVLSILFTTMAPTDFYPKSLRQLFLHYSIKTVPCLLIWLHISYQLMFKDFHTEQSPIAEEPVLKSEGEVMAV